MSAETYQAGVLFKAVSEAVLMALSKILETFFPFRVSQPSCDRLMLFDESSIGREEIDR